MSSPGKPLAIGAAFAALLFFANKALTRGPRRVDKMGETLFQTHLSSAPFNGFVEEDRNLPAGIVVHIIEEGHPGGWSLIEVPAMTADALWVPVGALPLPPGDVRGYVPTGILSRGA